MSSAAANADTSAGDLAAESPQHAPTGQRWLVPRDVAVEQHRVGAVDLQLDQPQRAEFVGRQFRARSMPGWMTSGSSGRRIMPVSPRTSAAS